MEGESGQPWRVLFMIGKHSDSMLKIKVYAEGCVYNAKMTDRTVLQKRISEVLGAYMTNGSY